ncbi:sodium:solute symporter family transporter [Arcobacter roscoffensis]|uniref:histidine kinase n=1 Tax=Arcobacter roscoffensis TaxID=2961520 RepID=A0ABY5E1J4_9BACT|nr:ATP-binding protein [Arcobacter roscoffensis]UTJ05424.1 ATP-binding protein [Arcobacter roscoffensis]
MFELYEVITIFSSYMLILFIFAYFLENKRFNFSSQTRAYLYSLSLAIYCTAWTYYGSVGKVTSSGIIFLAVYLGPTLIIFLWPIILQRLIKIKNRYKVTSLADLISVRYDKSMLIGAIVSFGTLVGIIPYISIQLKAIIQSIDILTINHHSNFVNENTSTDSIGLLIVFLMTFFTIIFGLRKLDPSERHFGMVFIVAIESIVKLIAILIIGIFVSFFLFPDISSILDEASSNGLFKQINSSVGVDYSSWISILILSMFAVMFLPRQFHISVVENSDISHIKTAMWVFPLYLLLITFFTIPIALAGELISTDHTLSDFYVLTIPLDMNKPILALIAFIGGFSASTSMIMITSMAMAIMVSNYFVLPLIQSSRRLGFLKKRLLFIRWIIVTLIIYLSYLFYLFVSKTNLIVNIGLISFTAILQFAPIILGGLFWERANKKGALAALITGFTVWFYTLIIPQFEKSQWISSYIIDKGLFGIESLKPTALFGLDSFSSIPHAVLFSMIFNISAYIIFSLLNKSTQIETKVAIDFINILENKEQNHYKGQLEDSIIVKEKMKIYEAILSDYFSSRKTSMILLKLKKEFKLYKKEKMNILQLSKTYAHIEKILAGTLGTAGAYSVLKNSEIFTEEESISLSNVYAKILKDMKITPEQFSEKINYFKEKEKLLTEHYSQLEEKVNQRDEEIEARKKAQEEIKVLNETLEQKVELRTKELKDSMDELKRTQENLIESEKMASLGELVAGVAHEINTPVGLSLTGITHFMSMASKLEKDYKDGNLSEEEFEEFIQTSNELSKTINLNLEKTAQLVRSFKQVAVDQSSDEKREFNLCEYLEEILISLNNITKKTKVKINIDCKKDISINSYAGVYSQIFTNLIMNSLKHAYERDEENSIDIIVDQNQDSIMIAFKDYGKGIKKENLSKIFNPFYTTSRDSGGSGLGLSIVYNLVTTKLEGTITCESKEKVGTTFNLIIPK